MPKTVVMLGVLCAIGFAACMTEESPPRSDDTVEPSMSSSVSELSSDSDLTPRTCTIAAFCAGNPVIGHPSYCIKANSCAPDTALDRAVTFCVNRCGVGCARDNIVRLANSFCN